jgi:transposase
MNANKEDLLKAILPTEVFEYFDIVKVDIDDKTIDIYLDELNLPPEQHQKEKINSKGFTEAVIIQDFPLRNKAVYLHVRRRKWQIESSGKIVSKTWDLTKKGSRYTKDFATFLKGILG